MIVLTTFCSMQDNEVKAPRVGLSAGEDNPPKTNPIGLSSGGSSDRRVPGPNKPNPSIFAYCQLDTTKFGPVFEKDG